MTCCRHFISRIPAALEDDINPDWLPSLNLGHCKISDRSIEAREERWRRRKTRNSNTVEPVILDSVKYGHLYKMDSLCWSQINLNRKQ